MKRIMIAAFTAALICGCAQKNSAPEPQASEKCSKADEKTAAAPQNPPSPEEMMAKMKEAGTPGKEHEALQPLIGKWSTESKMWMEPGKAPEVSKGTAINEWTLGKRFVKQDYTGKVMGQPFQGTGVFGYDKVKKEYVSTWIDSMGTGVMQGEGSFDPKNNAIEMNTKYSCPLTGGERSSRMVTRIISKNSHVLEMFDTGPDGKEFKTMEIVYKRKG